MQGSRSSGATANEDRRVQQNNGADRTIEVPRSPEPARLHESFKDDRAYLEKMVALDKSKRGTRVDAILTLKGSIEKSSSAIQSRNAHNDRKLRERDEEDAQRFDELLSQGLNPYEVARTRNVREVAAQERTKIERRIQEQQTSILKHLEVEKVWMQRQERVAQEQRAYEKKYQKEMGRAAVEERTTQYLVSRTGKETMDPTGKIFRLYPSQETTIKDRSFGLGKNLVHDADQRHRIVSKVHWKRGHRDAAPNEMLLPRVGEGSNNDLERSSSPGVILTKPVTRTPGQELEELNHSMLQREEDARASKDSLPPLDGAVPTKPKKGFGKPRRCVLEQRMLEQAREKQKTNIFQKQVVWGKEFTGRAFLAEPAEIWFKDFEVGDPMTLAFTLTNVSNTFNHFKLLDLDDAIKEFFDIKFEKPGRMSAGMSCRISISFTAIQARDIDTVIPAIAQTGAFSIPLRCTCKKAVPVMENRALEFKDVVAGEKQVLSLKLENRGALPLEFRVRWVQRSRSNHERSVPALDDREGSNTTDNANADGQAEVEDRSEELAADVPPYPVMVEPISSADDSATSAGNAESEVGEIDIADDEDDDVPSTTLSNSSSGASIGGEAIAALMDQTVALSTEERDILDRARATTVYKPEGADTPIRHTVSGTVAPYASSSITFTFAPASPMNIEDDVYIVEFPQATTAYRSAFWSPQLLSPMAITITAHATNVPVFVGEPELDFRCCLYDRLYRQQLIVCNRGSVALKIQIRVPKALEDCVEFHPNMGFVQGRGANEDGSFPVQIKFRPHTVMWKRLEAKVFGSAAAGFLAVPIQIVVPDQVVPVYFILMARVSSAALSFSHKRLDFGACTRGHSVVHTLAITNTSRLPQRIAFAKPPPEIRLENPKSTANPSDDGIATLLPLETKHFLVAYLPNASATTLSSRLVCRTTMNDEYSIAVTGECVATPLVFSHSVVQMGATQLGQMQTHSVSCANQSDKPQTIELVVPTEADRALRISPSVATIAAHASVRIEIEFTAAEELFAVRSSEYKGSETSDATTTAARSVRVNASGLEKTQLTPSIKSVAKCLRKPPSWLATNGIPPEERSVHHTWTVLCFREHGALVAFQVATSVIEPKLFAVPSELDFGQVAIGQTFVRELTFQNTSTYDVLLRSRPLHALGAFRVINSIQRPIRRRDGHHTVRVEFQPRAPLLYDDDLDLSCPELGVIRVALRGEGVNPSLRIQPEGGTIDFTDVLARSRTTREMQLTNASGFPLTLAILPLSDPSITSGGVPVITFSPSEATIPAQGTITVKVVFAPDHQRPQHYHQQYLIQVPNESERHVLSVSGRCWENQVYVYNPNEPPKLFATPPVEDMFDVPPSVNLTSLFSGTSLLNTAVALPGIKKVSAPLSVVFDSETVPTETKTVMIGATLPPAAEDDAPGQKAAGVAGGSFEFVIEEVPDKPQYAKLFTIEPAKGTVATAQQLPVHINYQRPANTQTNDSADAAVSHPELVVSQWIQVRVTCTLRGGALWRPLPSAFVAAPAAPTGKGTSAAASNVSSESDVRVVHLVLRAKMQT